MFKSRYRFPRLRHPRSICSFGNQRGILVYTSAFSTPPPEVIHHHSVIIPLGMPSEMIIMEWTKSEIDLHEVHL